MDARISAFIGSQRVATVCCTDEQHNPYCFNCFYVFNGYDYLLYFKSSVAARHDRLLRLHSRVAGTIVAAATNLFFAQGIQFMAEVLLPGDPLAAGATAAYYRKYPLAHTMPGIIWVLALDCVKMTDNRIGMGKKMSWHRMPAGGQDNGVAC
jgi:uncharacterized protein YhbP (UPF0306 family)